MAVRTSPKQPGSQALAREMTNVTKAAQDVNLAEISQLALLFRETSQSQKQLLDALIDNNREVLEIGKAQNQATSDLLQVLTSQSEMLEKQIERLLTVTLALSKATTALRALPPGSAIRSHNAPEVE